MTANVHSESQLPRMHKRERVVMRATADIKMAVLDVINAHDLTSWEEVRAVTDAFSTILLGAAKYEIREERHPGEPDRPGGLE